MRGGTAGRRATLDLGQSDLFAAPLPSPRSREDIVTAQEEQDLILAIERVGLTPFRFQQWTGKRLTFSFGWHYDFENASFGATVPIPDWLVPLKERAADFAGLEPSDLVQALLIRYDEGAGIGWHKDRPVFEQVVGISLGAFAEMRFRRRTADGFERFSVPLAPRSIYHLSGEIRHEWEHSIAPMEQARWSITFRSFSSAVGRPRD